MRFCAMTSPALPALWLCPVFTAVLRAFVCFWVRSHCTLDCWCVSMRAAECYTEPGGGRVEHQDEKLDKHFTLRVSSRLYDAIVRHAKLARRKPADWMRVVIEERIIAEDQADERRE